MGSGPIPGNPHPFPKIAGILLLLISHVITHPYKLWQPHTLLPLGPLLPSEMAHILVYFHPEQTFFHCTMAHSWILSCTKLRTYTRWPSQGLRCGHPLVPHTLPPATVTGMWWTVMIHQAVHLWQVYFSVCMLLFNCSVCWDSLQAHGHQTSLSFTISWSLLKVTSIE